MNSKKRVVITGIGPLSSAGIGRKDLWLNMLGSITGLTKKVFKIKEEILDKYYLHEINGFNIHNFDIDKDKLNEIATWKEGDEVVDLYYFLATVKLALLDSELQYDPDSNDIGLVLTAESPGHGDFYIKFLEKTYDFFTCDEGPKSKEKYTKKDFIYKFYKDFRKIGYDLQTFMFLFHVLKTYNLHGFSLFLNNACASGLYALEAAADAIRTNKSSAVIVSAVDHPDIFKCLWFKEINMSPGDGKIKPFDKNAKRLFTSLSVNSYISILI